MTWGTACTYCGSYLHTRGNCPMNKGAKMQEAAKAIRAAHWRVISATIEAAGDAGATLGELTKAMGLCREGASLHLKRHISSGEVFKAGPRAWYRYFLTAEAAAAADIRLHAAAEKARRDQVEKDKERKRRVYHQAKGQDPITNRRRDLRADVLACIVAAGPAGVLQAEIVERVRVCVRVAQKQVALLRKSGDIVSPRVWQDCRHFSDKQAAEVWKAERKAENEARKAETLKRHYAKESQRYYAQKALRPPKPPKAPKAAKPPKQRMPKRVAPKLGKELVKPSRFVPLPPKPQGPVIIPANVKRTAAEIKPGRYDVTGPIVGGFSTMRPGQYLPSDSAVARAFA